MTDYTKLIKELRETAKHLDGISRFPYDDDPAKRIYSKKIADTADAIVALGLDNEDYEHENRRLHGEIEALQAEQKKTVTQIFGEEQMAWEGRCKDLMKHISDLQSEIRESMQKCAECGDAQEQKVKGLQAEVERLKDSNEELREKQTYIDHYGDKWMTSAKDVPTAAYKHGYADGMAEERAKMQKRNAELHAELQKWVSAAEQAGEPKRGEWIVKGANRIDCSVCGHSICFASVLSKGSLTGYNYCPRCGAKMEVQDD